MMESLQMQTARVAFDQQVHGEAAPGESTQAGVLSGLNWLFVALGDRIKADAQEKGLQQILVTGGDATHLLALGFPGKHCPDLVLDGLEIAAGHGPHP
jgi:type III pantothenate kinase